MKSSSPVDCVRGARRVSRVVGLSLALALTQAMTGCSDEPTTSPAVLLGSWNATSFVATGVDFIAEGMSLTITFASDSTYTLDVTNDLVGACDPNPDCTTTGPYTATGTQVTFDPGAADEVVFTYAVRGATLLLSGSIGGAPAALTLTRA